MISFKGLKKEDLPLLLEWLNSQHVQQFWDSGTVWDEQSVQKKYSSYIEGYKIVDGKKLPIYAFIICHEDNPVGYIQFYDAFLHPRNGYSLKNTLKDSLFEHCSLAAIDVFIGEEDARGKGIGSRAIKQFLNEFVWNNFESCLVDPEITNTRAIRAYEKAGFSKLLTIPNQQIMIATSIR